MLWGGILALIALAGVLTYFFLQQSGSTSDRVRPEPRPRPENQAPGASKTAPDPDLKNAKKADTVEFDKLLAALDKLPSDEQAKRKALLDGFLKQYPESTYAPSVRTMLAEIQDQPKSEKAGPEVKPEKAEPKVEPEKAEPK